MRSPAELHTLARSHPWNKDLVLWSGTEDSCRKALGALSVETLDLLDLFDEGNPPSDEVAIREALVNGLRKRLRELSPGPAMRKILVIRSAALLARHRYGIRELYDWFCNDFGLAILVLEPGPEPTHWPDEVTCDPDRLLESFIEQASVKDVYGEVT